MTITNANIYSESYAVVKAFLESISGLDTKSRYKKTWIHSSMPNINDKGFSGYPFIIIDIDIAEDNRAFGRGSDKVFRIIIDVYAKDANNIDTIADSIYSNLTDETKLTSFHITSLDNSPLNWLLDTKGQKILNRKIGIMARRRV